MTFETDFMAASSELRSGPPDGLLLEVKSDDAHPALASFGADYVAPPLLSSGLDRDVVRIALVDTHELVRECITQSLVELYPQMSVLPFNSIDSLVAAPRTDIQLIIYHCHQLDNACLSAVRLLQRTFERVPAVIFADAHEADHLRVVREALQNGVQGFVSTRNTSILKAMAAIRFVKAGGTFAPLELLMGKMSDGSVEKSKTSQGNPLTQRQTAVLHHLKQGKANKIIAHELAMSESTVKVHVRNIMRRMGATNRTQAAFKAQSVMPDRERYYTGG